MSDRQYRVLNTQGVQHVQINGSILPQGMSMPLMGEGFQSTNPLGNGSQNPGGSTGPSGGGYTITRGTSGFAGTSGWNAPGQPAGGLWGGGTGVTGTYVLKTPGFTAIVGMQASLMFATTQGGAYSVEFGVPQQDTKGQFYIPFRVYDSAAATDISASPSNRVMLSLTFRNGPNRP